MSEYRLTNDPFLARFPRGMKTGIYAKTCIQMFTVAIFFE